MIKCVKWAGSRYWHPSQYTFLRTISTRSAATRKAAAHATPLQTRERRRRRRKYLIMPITILWVVVSGSANFSLDLLLNLTLSRARFFQTNKLRSLKSLFFRMNPNKHSKTSNFVLIEQNLILAFQSIGSRGCHRAVYVFNNKPRLRHVLPEPDNCLLNNNLANVQFGTKIDHKQ